VAPLGAQIAQQAQEIEFLNGVLAAHRRAAAAAGRKGKPAAYAQIQTQRNGEQGLTVKPVGRLAQVSRAGLYRYHPARSPSKPDMARPSSGSRWRFPVTAGPA
jgi:hypothetical protein